MPVAVRVRLSFTFGRWIHPLPVEHTHYFQSTTHRWPISLVACCAAISSIIHNFDLASSGTRCGRGSDSGSNSLCNIASVVRPSATCEYSFKANRIMSYSMRCTLVFCVAFALFAAGCIVEASKTRPPRNNEINTMADALKYLQDLDVYYGDRARVRFGKRGSLMQAIRNRMLLNGINTEPFNDNNNGGELIHDVGQEEMF